MAEQTPAQETTAQKSENHLVMIRDELLRANGKNDLVRDLHKLANEKAEAQLGEQRKTRSDVGKHHNWNKKNATKGNLGVQKSNSFLSRMFGRFNY